MILHNILQGKDIHIVDLYTVPTWLPPMSCDPMLSLPVSMHFPITSYAHKSYVLIYNLSLLL